MSSSSSPATKRTKLTTTDDLEAFDVEGNLVEYDPVAVQEQADKMSCKATAQQLLSATDWTTIPDVSNPEVSNPYLMNQSEFAAYRSTVRNYAVNPVVDPVWPTIPTEQWSN